MIRFSGKRVKRSTVLFFRLSTPTDILLDSSSPLYTAEPLNNCILRYSLRRNTFWQCNRLFFNSCSTYYRFSHLITEKWFLESIIVSVVSKASSKLLIFEDYNFTIFLYSNPLLSLTTPWQYDLNILS